MKTLKLTDKGPRLSQQTLDRFERRIGTTLPVDYRAFLLSCNGGYPEDELSFPFGKGRKKEESVLSMFYPLAPRSDECHLDNVRATLVMAGRMPRSLLPIADDAFGNQICLGISGEVLGAVYFWDHEREPETDYEKTAFDNITFVAKSFSAFLELLTPLDVEDEE